MNADPCWSGSTALHDSDPLFPVTYLFILYWCFLSIFSILMVYQCSIKNLDGSSITQKISLYPNGLFLYSMLLIYLSSLMVSLYILYFHVFSLFTDYFLSLNTRFLLYYWRFISLSCCFSISMVSLYYTIFLLHLSGLLYLYSFSLYPDVSLSLLRVSLYISADFSLYTWLFISLFPKIYLYILGRFISLSRRFISLYMKIYLSLLMASLSIIHLYIFSWNIS